MRRVTLLLVVCGAPLAAGAQAPAGGGDGNGGSAGTPTELETVRVLGQRPPADPFAFRNPVEVDGTVFSRDWDEPPSLEEIGMRGGIVQIAIGMGLEATARGIRKLPGWKLQPVAASARPPPLDDEQLRRAAALQAEPAP